MSAGPCVVARSWASGHHSRRATNIPTHPGQQRPLLIHRQRQPIRAESWHRPRQFIGRSAIFPPSDPHLIQGGRCYDGPPPDLRTAQTLDNAHGRIEARAIATSTEAVPHFDWPGLGQIARLNARAGLAARRASRPHQAIDPMHCVEGIHHQHLACTFDCGVDSAVESRGWPMPIAASSVGALIYGPKLCAKHRIRLAGFGTGQSCPRAGRSESTRLPRQSGRSRFQRCVLPSNQQREGPLAFDPSDLG